MGGPVGASLAVLRQNGHGRGIEGDTALLMGLRVLLPRLPVALTNASIQRDNAGGQVDLAPLVEARTPSTVVCAVGLRQCRRDGTGNEVGRGSAKSASDLRVLCVELGPRKEDQ